MESQLKFIKYCIVCSRMVPMNSRECEVCSGEFIIRELNDEELNISLTELNTEIKDAYFLLEKYKEGRIRQYQTYYFLKAFKQLFSIAKYNLENCKLITFYWHLNEQVSFDFENRNFKNMEAYYNPDFSLDCLGIQEINETLEYEFSQFMNSDDFDNSPRVISILALDNTLTYTNTLTTLAINSKRKSIQFNSPDILQKVFDELKGFFQNNLSELQQALDGEDLLEPILFPHQQNKLAEFFKRLQYNNYVVNNKSEVCAWLCKNFNFIYVKGNVSTVRSFNRSSVWGVLSQDKGIPPKTSRIGVSDWLPYKPTK